jgi:hypothetical protein
MKGLVYTLHLLFNFSVENVNIKKVLCYPHTLIFKSSANQKNLALSIYLVLPIGPCACLRENSHTRVQGILFCPSFFGVCDVLFWNTSNPKQNILEPTTTKIIFQNN